MSTETKIYTIEWLDINQAAAYLKRSVRAVYNLVNKGKLPYHKFNGRLLFNRAELDQAILSCRTKAYA